MGKLVLVDAFVEVAGIDFTDHVSSVVITMQSEEIDVTSFADLGKRRSHGMSDDSFQLTFSHDFDPDSVDAALFPLYAGGSDFLIRARPFSAAVSTSNPQFSGTCTLLSYTPLAGDAGTLSQASMVFPVQGFPISRVTA